MISAKQLADRIASCERVHLKYVTLIKNHQEIEEEKTWVLPLVNLNIEELDEFWSLLDKRYGGKGKHIDAIMATAKNIPKYTEDDVAEIIHMINILEKAHQDLLRLVFEKDINKSTIVSIIEERMPDSLKKEWIKLVTGQKR